jgi:hypothetical protein
MECFNRLGVVGVGWACGVAVAGEHLYTSSLIYFCFLTLFWGRETLSPELSLQHVFDPIHLPPIDHLLQIDLVRPTLP